MGFIKRLATSFIILSVIFTICIPAYALDGDTAEDTVTATIINDSDNTDKVDALNKQLNELYKEVGKELNINYMYVKILHMIAGGKAIYSEEIPNIYVDLTVDSFDAPFDIKGANQSYKLQAPWAICPDEDTIRPSKYYLPDAAYNVTASIIAIMNSRYKADRGSLQEYFDVLSNDVKTTILFCEAVLQYIGASEEEVNSFYTIYERFLYKKECNENVLEINEDGKYIFKEKFLDILNENGIRDEWFIEVLGIVLRFDSKLAASSNLIELSSSYIIPYKLDYTSRENLMLAATSLVGKVRYVWGGGHCTTNKIKGINPLWEVFYNLYGTPEDNENYFNCIRPNNGWCPIHGTVDGGNGCLPTSKTVYSINEYLGTLGELVDTSGFDSDVFKDLMSEVNFEGGLTSHRLDGLDCSGYASWLFSQITDKYNFDSGALNFIGQTGMRTIDIETEKILPGDVFSWGEHIIVFIGAYSNSSSVYIHIESTPDTVKFGVSYFDGSSYKDIYSAKKLADEANQLFGNIDITREVTSIYNLSNLAMDEGESEGYREFGRLRQTYIDEYTVLTDFHKRLVNMTAQEILQHTVDSIGAKYLSGANNYKGKIFSLENVELTYNVSIVSQEVDESNITLTTELSEDGAGE